MRSLLLWARACALLLLLSIRAFAADAVTGHFPIIFAHGIGVPPILYEKIVPLQKVFRELGYDVYIARTPIDGSLLERSEVLRDEIERLVPEGRFHLVGHSMGGLDARLVVRRYPEIARRCVSVTTLASPHHGSPVADYVMKHLDDLADRSSLARAIMKLLGDDINAVRDLTTTAMEQTFNARVGDVDGIQYYSIGFYIPEPVELHSVAPVLWAAHSIVEKAGEPHNDGFVSVESARWGQSLGVYPADHWSETAPVPFFGGKSYKEISARIVENLVDHFER